MVNSQWAMGNSRIQPTVLTVGQQIVKLPLNHFNGLNDRIKNLEILNTQPAQLPDFLFNQQAAQLNN
jgi:hypothetical protein